MKFKEGEQVVAVVDNEYGVTDGMQGVIECAYPAGQYIAVRTSEGRVETWAYYLNAYRIKFIGLDKPALLAEKETELAPAIKEC